MFGQKANSFHNVSISLSSINIGDIDDIVEANSVVGGEPDIEFPYLLERGLSKANIRKN